MLLLSELQVRGKRRLAGAWQRAAGCVPTSPGGRAGAKRAFHSVRGFIASVRELHRFPCDWIFNI